jgi:hypothetical protein
MNDSTPNLTKAPNFASIMDESPDHVEQPKARPVGPYIFIVGAPTHGKSKQKGTPFVQFPLRALSAEDGVDPDALEEAGGIDGFKTSITFYKTEDSIFRLDLFHEHCGIDLKSDKHSRTSRCDMVVNAQVLGIVEHEYPRDPETNEPDTTKEPFVRVNKTAPAE